MPLNQCKECGNTLSNQAKTCPHCGTRVRKSRWGLVVLFALIVGACVIILPCYYFDPMRGYKDGEVEKNVKTIVEENVREVLNEKYGIQCVSINLLEGSDGSFSGTAKLEDGREIEIADARIDGEMIRFNRSVKQGYEYKCKHHIDQLKLDDKIGLREVPVLVGQIWNHGCEPIRGFVAAEFIDDNGRIYYRHREKIFGWIPPGKNTQFYCIVPSELVKSDEINVKLEFFNLGNEPIASYVYDNPFDESILQTIPVKLDSQIHNIQKEKTNQDAQ